ncbi:MAG: NUDIX hydrolase [Peptococcaceae bacterium]|jgi:ADP-ribose pyrophosphatase|nr:NUDIX hydrolase [Peptococcaceae bacterium]
MSDLSETRLNGEVVFQGKFLRVEKDEVCLPNGKKSSREVIRHPSAVAIVARQDDDLILVRQYRYALGVETVEIPAGKMEQGEDPDLCAQRELREETGYSGHLTLAGSYYSTPGFTDERMYLYLATDLAWAPLTPDEDEFLHVVRIPIRQAIEDAISGKFYDAKTILGVLLAQAKGFLSAESVPGK